jgi:hypothetical protein
MATRGARRGGPVSPSAPRRQPEKAAATAVDAATAGAALGDRLLYSGNRHETVPRALLLDRRLTPLERNAWQVFRLQLQDDAGAVFPTYEQLRPYLASMPCAGAASHETVARALTLLRLTRWLSLVRRRRDPETGCILGNVYVLHDEPLAPFEAMRLDEEYLELIAEALTHAAKAVRIVAVNALKEIDADPMVDGRMLPSRLQVLMQRLGGQGWTMSGYPQAAVDRDSEEGSRHSLRNRDDPSSESEPSCKPAADVSLRNPKTARTVRMEQVDEVRTVPSSKLAGGLRIPDNFGQLTHEQRAGAFRALKRVDEALQQAVFDEWAMRCRGRGVRNPAGYLFGLIQRAINGEFKVCSGAFESEPAAPAEACAPLATPVAPVTSPKMADPDFIRACLARLNSSLIRK